MKKKFLRRDTNRYSKFGKRRKKLLGWRKPKGRDNKMREKRKGYPTVVKIGYKQKEKLKGLIQEKTPILVNNIKDLKKIIGKKIGIVGKIGKKKKLEIAKKAKEMKVELKNMNINSFLKKHEKKEQNKK